MGTDATMDPVVAHPAEQREGAAVSPSKPALQADWLPPARTALVVVDVQVDFVSPTGAMGTVGLDMAPLEAPLQRIEALVAAARTAGASVVWMRVVTRPETDAEVLKTLYLRKGLPLDSLAICRAGSAGVGYYRVAPAPGDIEIEKPIYSGFYSTTLEAQLRAAGIDTLVFTGFTTECCVDINVREAFHRGFHCLLVEDACAAYSPQLHDVSVQALGYSCALVVGSTAVLAAWQGDAR